MQEPGLRRGRRRRDDAMSDFVGTLMLAGLVVAGGAAIAVMVSDGLTTPTPPPAAVAVAPVSPADDEVRLAFRTGAPLVLADLGISLQRAGGALVDVPRAAWTTPGSTRWLPGESLTFPLDPPAGEGEDLRVLVRAKSGLLADVRTATAASDALSSPLGAPTLTAAATPSSLVADASSASRLTVRVSHPAGAAGVAAIVADISNITRAAGGVNATLALRDTGVDGDEVGGDGVWSALLRAPVNTTVGDYVIGFSATDLAGHVVARTDVVVNVNSSLAAIAANATGGGAGGNSTGGNVTGGTCYGCIGGDRVIEGTQFDIPNSSAIQGFSVRNWVWDTKHQQKLDSDEMWLVVTNVSGAYWEARIRLRFGVGGAEIMDVTTWNAQNETLYEPKNSTLRLSGLQLNLLDPVASDQLKFKSGSLHPTALYPASNVGGAARLSVLRLGDSDRTSAEQAILAADVVVS